jgi:hypothetical protein
MRKFLQQYGKQIMAVVSVALMIAFFLPQFKNPGGGRNPVIGTIGKDKVYGMERYYAKQEWDLLTHTGVGPQHVSLAAGLLGPAAVESVRQHPELYLLLLKEAQRMNVRVSRDEVESFIKNELGDLSEDDERSGLLRQAVADVLSIRAAFVRASSVVKISQPMVRQALAHVYQTISVNLVEFDAAKYSSKISPPANQQIREQFDKYADRIAGQATAGNPFGFGYKYPDRLKLQYVESPRGEVRKAVEATRDAHRWEVEARKYYLQHLEQFAATQPAIQASTAPATAPLAAAPAAPTTRPFDQVRNDIKEQLIAVETNKLQAAIVEKISASLGADYMTYHAVVGTATAPTTLPASSLGPAYNSFEYLQKLAGQIQQQYKVLPTVASLADTFLSPQNYLAIAGFGQATYEGRNIADYLATHVAVFAPIEQRGESGILHRWQPSSMLRDEAGNLYILRVSDAEVAHRPATPTEVEYAVRADWIQSQAYQQAKIAAEKLLSEAKVKGLRPAAAAASAMVISVSSVNQRGAPMQGYAIAPPAGERFIAESFKLLSTTRPSAAAQPLRLIELPQAGKAIVAELADVAPMWKPQFEYAAIEQVAGEASSLERFNFRRWWFDYNSVVSRLSYVNTETSGQEPTVPPAPAEPIF